MNTVKAALLATAVVGVGSFMGVSAASADPLGGKDPWNFTPQNRAAIAIAIRNAEEGTGEGGGGGTTVVCGGTSGAGGDGSNGSGSSATGNSTCVIVNNSDGAIVDVDQASAGNQSSSSSTNTTSSTSNNSSGPHGSIDEVAAILSGRAR